LKVGTLVLRTLLARLVGLNDRRGPTALSLTHRDDAASARITTPLVGVLAHPSPNHSAAFVAALAAAKIARLSPLSTFSQLAR